MTSSVPALPPVRVIDLGHRSPAALVEAEPERARALLEAGRHTFGGAVLRLGDRASRRWLTRAANPYAGEIAAAAAVLPEPGGWVLNLSHEWGCTSAISMPAPGVAPRLLRTLDWPMEGLGENLLAVRRRGPAGPWLDLTWPGFVGVVQALAPGRFAAAFNQAPLDRTSGIFPLDWLIQRRAFWRSRALPPAHLLRRVFEEAGDYDEARTLLSETPLALPVIFTLAGCRPGEGCIIERLETRAFERPLPAVAGNHWDAVGRPAYPRGVESRERGRLMAARLEAAGLDLDWLAPPILNPLTRLAFAAEPAGGRLVVQGFESYGPATAILDLCEAETGIRPAGRTIAFER
jgi:hypothetical protein